MKQSLLLLSVLFVTGLCGCGGGDGAGDVPAAPPAPPVVTEVGTSTPSPAPAPATPPSGVAPAVMEQAPADPLEAVKISRDGTPNKSDLEALQAVVDAYAVGIDGLGAPAIASLDVLVAKGFLKRIPPAPAGKKWAYDSAKWKVSLVDQ